MDRKAVLQLLLENPILLQEFGVELDPILEKIESKYAANEVTAFYSPRSEDKESSQYRKYLEQEAKKWYSKPEHKAVQEIKVFNQVFTIASDGTLKQAS